MGVIACKKAPKDCKKAAGLVLSSAEDIANEDHCQTIYKDNSNGNRYKIGGEYILKYLHNKNQKSNDSHSRAGNPA